MLLFLPCLGRLSYQEDLEPVWAELQVDYTVQASLTLCVSLGLVPPSVQRVLASPNSSPREASLSPVRTGCRECELGVLGPISRPAQRLAPHKESGQGLGLPRTERPSPGVCFLYSH